jgi:hypothetical protein
MCMGLIYLAVTFSFLVLYCLRLSTVVVTTIKCNVNSHSWMIAINELLSHFHWTKAQYGAACKTFMFRSSSVIFVHYIVLFAER